MGINISKRAFIKSACFAAAGSVCIDPLSASVAGISGKGSSPANDLWKWSKECMHYEITPKGTRCLICPNACVRMNGETTLCRNRVNYKGKLYTIAYGNPCAMHVDPIEKKPLYHFLPGTRSFSIATAGCNLACLNCQNWSISQASPKETRNYSLMPEKVTEQAVSNNCRSISYTYSEPITFYEYVYDSSVIARRSGIKNVLVSNGYINEKPLHDLCQVMDAANIDLKSFDENIYSKLNAGKLQPVLNSLKIFKQEGVWLEITNLVIPGWTDNLEMIRKMCDWLYQNDFQDTPLHFSRFQPLYKLNHLPPTPVAVLEKAKAIALNVGLKFVYIGNVSGSSAISTICPKCKKTLVERNGFSIVNNAIKNGNCSFCGTKIPGRWT